MSTLGALLFLSYLSCVRATSAGYDTILTIVIVEVIFAFVIGVVCILLSFNLFRALKDSPESYTGLPVGEFPLSRGVSHNVLNGTEEEGGRLSTPHSPVEREGQSSYYVLSLSCSSYHSWFGLA
jgi:hypothetical protein